MSTTETEVQAELTTLAADVTTLLTEVSASVAALTAQIAALQGATAPDLSPLLAAAQAIDSTVKTAITTFAPAPTPAPAPTAAAKAVETTNQAETKPAA